MNDVIRYNINLFTDSSKPLANDHRLVVIRFKETKDAKAKGTKKPPSYCASIPRSEVVVEPEDLIKPLTAALHDLEEQIIREKVETFLEDQTTEKNITNIELNATSVSIFYDRVATSGRLSKESIAAWFDTDLMEPLVKALMAAVPELIENGEKLEKAIESHRNHICNLASPRANMPVKLATQLKKAVVLASDDESSKIKPSLISKLDAFITPPTVAELDLGL